MTLAGNEQTLAKLENLKRKVFEFKEQQTNARAMVSALEMRQKQLDEELLEFGLDDWHQAGDTIEQFRNEAESLAETIKDELGKAGVQV